MNKTKVGTPTQNKDNNNIFQYLSNLLPDNRPIRGIKVVENYENVPANYHVILKSYDQDNDADLWREKILFGKRTSRYLCISKDQSISDQVVAELKVTDKVEIGWTSIGKTIDTDQKAWRKQNQIVFKLANPNNITHAITDIILCSKLRRPPEGFKLAGEIEKVLVCYKVTEITPTYSNTFDFTKQIEDLKIRSNFANSGADNNNEGHYYEQLRLSYQISPTRPAPSPPDQGVRKAPARPPPPSPLHPIHGNNNHCQNQNANYNKCGTLSQFSEVEGVPFELNPSIKISTYQEFNLPNNFSMTSDTLEYDFMLERETLIQTKSDRSSNPFFH